MQTSVSGFLMDQAVYFCVCWKRVKILLIICLVCLSPGDEKKNTHIRGRYCKKKKKAMFSGTKGA